ncbi:MAG: peptidylprolyl isomerase [Flavobacteriales bacterium]|nr:MAG: peptidylprolyl isomerase [Flavobacteriales bacterium]
MPKIIKTALFLGFIWLVFSCGNNSRNDLPDGLYAEMHTEKGEILIRLYYDTVPITVANFVSLAKGDNPLVNKSYKGKAFFNGLTFHRVESGYVVQTGAPGGRPSGNAGYKFEDEIPHDKQGQLLLKHDKPGVVSMANSGKNTNGSQFFITLRETPNLDGLHSVFGQVVEGQQVVDSIKKGDRIKKIKIINVGEKAKKFDAKEVFSNYFQDLEKRTAQHLKALKKVKDSLRHSWETFKTEAVSLPSGLKMYYLKKNDSIKPPIGSSVRINYAGFFTTADLFDTNVEAIAKKFDKFNQYAANEGKYMPMAVEYSPDAAMVHGFREGVLNLRVGEKAWLFIPSHLGYGKQQYGPIPPNTNLVFLVELLYIE